MPYQDDIFTSYPVVASGPPFSS